eukprot:scaffold131712_cov60-Phaeocystis_antarctica.AAC.2
MSCRGVAATSPRARARSSTSLSCRIVGHRSTERSTFCPGSAAASAPTLACRADGSHSSTPGNCATSLPRLACGSSRLSASQFDRSVSRSTAFTAVSVSSAAAEPAAGGSAVQSARGSPLGARGCHRWRPSSGTATLGRPRRRMLSSHTDRLEGALLVTFEPRAEWDCHAPQAGRGTALTRTASGRRVGKFPCSVGWPCRECRECRESRARVGLPCRASWPTTPSWRAPSPRWPSDGSRAARAARRPASHQRRPATAFRTCRAAASHARPVLTRPIWRRGSPRRGTASSTSGPRWRARRCRRPRSSSTPRSLSTPSPVWPASAAQAAGWPRLAEAWGSRRHGPALREATGEPAGRGLSPLGFDAGLDAAWR